MADGEAAVATGVCGAAETARSMSAASVASLVGPRTGGLLLLAFGHLTCDFYATYLTPLLPLIADRFRLSTFMCSMLVAVIGISGSTLQPLFGAIGGQGRSKTVVVAGMVLMAVFFSCMGLAPNVFFLVLMLIAGGLGCSLFHPHAASIATSISAGRRGLAMSLFTVAGTAGIFLTPKVVPRIASSWGLEAPVVTMPIGLVCAVALLGVPQPAASSGGSRAEAATEWRGFLAADIGALGPLVVSATLYSLTVSGFCAFLPLMLCREKGYTITAAGDVLSWLILAGALGVVVGGYLSDRVGRWRVIMAAYLMSAPFFSGFLATSDLWAQVLLIAGGAVLWAAQPCTITLAQELAPRASAIASGLVMGFAWGIAGLALPLFGMIADRAGTAHAMQWLVLLPIGAAVSLWVARRYARGAKS